MRNFDFYEFAAFLAPGTLVLVGFLVFFPGLSEITGQNITLGAFGLGAIVSYVLGHLVQAAGNALEALWWKLWGGMPTDWIRTARRPVIGAHQAQELRTRLKPLLEARASADLAALPAQSWRGLTREMHAAVSGQSRGARLDALIGNYGLNRGVAAALLALIVLSWALGEGTGQATALLAAGAAIALYRMHRFALHYAQELVAQYLQLPKS